jgi:hypothetical protein
MPGQADNYVLVKIREDERTLAAIEWMVGGRSLLEVSRLQSEQVERPTVGWDLAGIDRLAAAGGVEETGPAVVKDMVIPNVTVAHMVERADFETYIFASDPPWAGERQITDIIDPASPGSRAFIFTWRASDKRHVVLAQMPTYNRVFGSMAARATVVYTSPNGFKVLSQGEQDKMGAEILLRSAQHVLKDPPAEDRTGYILESPAGTYPALAINGPVSDTELHALIDSLIPARQM